MAIYAFKKEKKDNQKNIQTKKKPVNAIAIKGKRP